MANHDFCTEQFITLIQQQTIINYRWTWEVFREFEELVSNYYLLEDQFPRVRRLAPIARVKAQIIQHPH